ncbi:c-type cytochrome [Rhodospirillum centenum]|uniref:Cytochrome c n=1 Tax=Rhodospirillum centenum (strain ATCC 51521 / SW) TaxID=414684 RepID=B6ISA6_RHOCS|nr:cytochrome c [Rhodospirillum centenum]ACI98342.1 cytochrome c' [Rhodospirillum centenum SW]
MKRPISKLFQSALLSAGLVAVAAVGTAMAQDPADAVKQRQSQMKEIGGAMKSIQAFVKDGKGTAAEVKTAAETVVTTGPKFEGLWPEGTAVGFGKSEAKAAIWTEMEKFAKGFQAMGQQAELLVKVADTGDRAAIGKQFGALYETCKSCHEAYHED